MNVSPYRTATIVIVNDSKVRTGNVSANVFYGGLNFESTALVASELLNYLTGHEVGYRARTISEKSAIRTELLNALYYTFHGVDYAVIAGNAYSREFVAGKSINMDGCFKTYILGKEVPEDKVEYSYTYYDKQGNKLDEAPSKPGTYKVVAELPVTNPCAYDSNYEYLEVTSAYQVYEEYDEEYGYYQVVYDGDTFLGWIDDSVTAITIDGALYCVPRSRGTSTFTIIPVSQAGKRF